MRVTGDKLEMLYASVLTREILLRYHQVRLPPGTTQKDLPNYHIRVVCNPVYMQQSLSYDPILSWWRMLIPSYYSISRFTNAEYRRKRAIACLGKRLKNDLKKFDLFKKHWEQMKKTYSIILPDQRAEKYLVVSINGNTAEAKKLIHELVQQSPRLIAFYGKRCVELETLCDIECVGNVGGPINETTTTSHPAEPIGDVINFVELWDIQEIGESFGLYYI
jgi:hypothetical protein